MNNQEFLEHLKQERYIKNTLTEEEFLLYKIQENNFYTLSSNERIKNIKNLYKELMALKKIYPFESNMLTNIIETRKHNQKIENNNIQAFKKYINRLRGSNHFIISLNHFKKEELY